MFSGLWGQDERGVVRVLYPWKLEKTFGRIPF